MSVKPSRWAGGRPHWGGARAVAGVLAVATALLLAACGAGGAKGDAALPTLTIANGDASNGPVGAVYGSVQIAEGWDKQEGFTLKAPAVQGASTAVQMLLSGSAQFAQATSAVAYETAAKDDRIRIIGFWNGPMYLISALQGSGINTAADLAGKTVGIFAIGSGADLMTRGAISAAGVNLKTVKFLPVPVGAPTVEALNSGKIDAVASWQGRWQTESALSKVPFQVVHSQLSTMLGQFALVTTADFIKKHRDEAVGFVRNMYKSCALGVKDPERVVADHWKVFPQVQPPADQRAQALKDQAKWNRADYVACAMPSPDTGKVGVLSTKEIDATYQDYLKSGVVTQKVDVSKIVDPSIAEDALKNLNLDAFVAKIEKK